ncbi:MFS family permease [Nocardioides zeae]|uniref:MFS family permease n=1 Tax=Nocardioides zeae TaxID=1457234 RepID=A0ACC6IF47_9ACTN|nr:MFS transporter [Nocardioides zeae]MDR6176388.1 MFS family permease [Nocardioides zeae]MDR6209401.1 MFS family permease [Nocardioides zeae]
MGATGTAERRALLADRAFLRLWAGTTASGLATWAMPFVLGLAVVDGSLGATALGVALAARTVGFLVVLPVAGVLADRHAPRVVVLLASGVAAAGSFALAAALGRSVVATTAAALLVGAGQGACRPAFQALVPATVAEPDRQAANAAITVAVRASVLLGPAVAGLGAAVAGAAWLVTATGVLWVVAAVAPARTARVGAVGGAAGRRPGFRAEFVEGLREARRHPWFLGGLGALATVIMTGYSVTAVALPLVSADVTGSGVLLAAGATSYTTGALLGGLLLARWRPPSTGWVALGGLGIYAVAPLALALDPRLPVVVAAYVVVGFGIELFNVPWFTALQREVAPERLSRVSSLDFLVSYGLAPLGLALVAPAVDLVGMRAVLLGCAVACVLGPALAALVPGSRHLAATTPTGRAAARG